ncbi:MAG: glycoside hydrolase family 38 C-terminal domain-containing protein [Chloroflexota bacterium]
MPRRKPKDNDRSADLPQDWIKRHIERLEAFALREAIPLTSWAYRRAEFLGPGQYKPLDADWQVITLGEQWGGPNTTAFFKKQVIIPESHAGPDTFLDIDLDGGETQLSINGRLWQGLDFNRSLVPLGEFATADHPLTLEMEAFIINYPYDDRRHDEREYHTFKRANMVLRDPVVETAVFDIRFVFNAYLHYWQSDEQFEIEGFLLAHLEEACRILGPMLPTAEAAHHAAKKMSVYLKEHLFESDYYRHKGLINICAHSHLDIVYLWSINETYRKNGRTTSNMLSLLREYPDYIYSQSQPFLYEKLKEHYPAMFEEVKYWIAQGRWEVIGALYVEPDANIIGPESWVRQIMFGKRFIQDELGVDTSICWMPDVFGLVYTLPQILKKAGVDYLLTSKLNIWNDTNVFPYDSFYWRGLDGSQIITHFPPTHFAQNLKYSNLRRQWNDFREKQISPENLFVYGWGDGGGGPTREMVESSLRAKQFPGLPKTQITLTENFFQNLANHAEQLSVWDDELYLEAHRGTYTSKSFLKRNNRRAELFYRDIEILSALASLFGGPRIQEALNEGWKLLLLNQFHDTLPGTHVAEVVSDIKADYAELFEIGEAIYQSLMVFFQKNIASDKDVLLINTLSWDRTELIAFADQPQAKAMTLYDGSTIPVQHWEDKTWVQPRLPSLGWTVGEFVSRETAVFPNVATFSNNQIKTAYYQITLDHDGNLAQIMDRLEKREILSAAGNQFQVFEDDPGKKFGAWDIAYHFETYQYPVEQIEPWQLIENGPIFAVFTAAWRVLNSTITQKMLLYSNSPRIDFQTEVDWQDSKKLLKVAFPLRIRSRTATYDLPFGHIERPTHRNTKWDQAKYEVCGHKWADLSEGDYGVSLLNDCKYGYDIHENVLRLSLVRSPTRPTPRSDIGLHRFTYSLLPHAGNWRTGQVTRHAYALNCPAIGVEINHANPATLGKIPENYSFLQVGSKSIIVEVLKQAEVGQNIILRTFDAHGTHSNPKISICADLSSVGQTDLLEKNPEEIRILDGNAFHAPHDPYEINTFSLVTSLF